ncbi:TfoX/Sxy family protein [Reichenbachiella sp.]|uniref:TfoX/Sxy family protein n=1 Tax=Reichenbachiella sp. TaxID=2184521 RepID=UPI003BAFB52D
MAYDEYLGERINNILKDKSVNFYSKKMMGGLLFMVDDKMFCGIHIDKKYGDSLLMARVGEEAYQEHIDREECLPMDFTGRPMKGYIFITPAGFDFDDGLAHWIDLCLAFNPLAKASKPKSKSARKS